MKHTTLISAAIALAPLAAFADDAADHLAKATRLYDLQEWSQALDEYKAAYMLEPKPATLWAIAQTQRLSGDCRSAILSYKAYMRGSSTVGANAAMEFITTCQADLDAQRKAVEATTHEPEKPAPDPAQPPVATPRPTTATPPAAPARAHEHAPRSWMFDPLGDALFVAGVGGLVVGGTLFAIGALDAHDAPNQPSSGEYDRLASSASRDQWIGGVVGGVGVMCGALAVWRFTNVRASRLEHPSNSFVLVPARDGAFAAYAARF